MTTARSYLCPSCGARVAEHSRTCAYCRAPVATVRCAACFHMNVADAVHCSGCGVALGLEPVPAPSELACPSCAGVMDQLRGARGVLWDCRDCGGQFADHDMLRELVERRQPLASLGRAPAPPRATGPLEPVRYRRCPVCDGLMNRKNFGDLSGVIVDVCGAHGTFLDPGELPRILAFVESGGLLASERRRLERERQRERERAVARATTSTAPAPVDTFADRAPDWMTVADAVTSLLAWLRAH